MAIYRAGDKAKLNIGAAKVKKMYRGDVKVYSAGNICTYHVDTGITYQEEVDEGASCLSPKSFTPAKAGWTFLGWRGDASANANIHHSLVMGDGPVTLYAVFRQVVTVTYYNGSTAAGSTSGYRYYNNGNVANPSFTLTQAALSGWSARGWSTSAAANGGIAYANGAAFTRDSNITLYGMYQQIITLSYNGNGATGGSVAAQTGIRYYNSNGAVINPTFTVSANAFSRTGYIFQHWRLNGTTGTVYTPGGTIAPGANSILYAEWVVSVSSGESSAHISFTGGSGGTTDTKYLYLSDAAVNKRLKATVTYDTDNGIFNGVTNQMAEIRCGNTVIYSRNYGGASGKNHETKEVSWIQTGKTLALTVSAHKDKNEAQYTQWCRGTISISGISG